MDLFSNFATTPYTFLKYANSIHGKTVANSYAAEGVFKLRKGVTTVGNVTNTVSTASLHIKPSEAFLIGLGDVVDNGVIVNGTEYRITGVTNGMGGINFDVLEHITLTLQVEAETATA